MPRHWTGLALTFAVVALDRATKLWIQANVTPFETREIIPGLFNIVHSENRGMAFGIGNDGATWYTRLFLIVVSLAVLGALAYGVWNGQRSGTAAGEKPSSAKSAELLALFLVGGGALGNLYDRIVHGAVTDFLDVFVGTYHWPTFNIADCAVTVGALILIGLALLGDGKRGTVAA